MPLPMHVSFLSDICQFALYPQFSFICNRGQRLVQVLLRPEATRPGTPRGRIGINFPASPSVSHRWLGDAPPDIRCYGGDFVAD